MQTSNRDSNVTHYNLFVVLHFKVRWSHRDLFITRGFDLGLKFFHAVTWDFSWVLNRDLSSELSFCTWDMSWGHVLTDRDLDLDPCLWTFFAFTCDLTRLLFFLIWDLNSHLYAFPWDVSLCCICLGTCLWAFSIFLVLVLAVACLLMKLSSCLSFFSWNLSQDLYVTLDVSLSL